MRKLIAFVVSLAGAYLVATLVGKWFISKYAGGGFISVGPFPGFDQGFLFGYIFFASLLLPLATNKFKLGFYFALPVLIFDLLHPSDPQWWMDIILMAAGLGLAWLILFAKNRIKSA